ILTEGFNGALPNLDMVNVIVFYASHYQLPISLFENDWVKDPNMNLLFKRLLTLWHHILNQLLSVPTGVHGIFRRESIHAVTITNEKSKQYKKGNIRNNMFIIGSVIEATIRCLNNLLEELHQSFFLYFLDGMRTYMGFESFMP